MSQASVFVITKQSCVTFRLLYHGAEIVFPLKTYQKRKCKLPVWFLFFKYVQTFTGNVMEDCVRPASVILLLIITIQILMIIICQSICTYTRLTYSKGCSREKTCIHIHTYSSHLVPTLSSSTPYSSAARVNKNANPLTKKLP